MANNKVIGMDDIIGTLFAIQEEIKATDNTLRNSSFFSKRLKHSVWVSSRTSTNGAIP